MQRGIIHVTGVPQPINEKFYSLKKFKVLNSGMTAYDINEGNVIQTDEFAYFVVEVKRDTDGYELILRAY